MREGAEARQRATSGGPPKPGAVQQLKDAHRSCPSRRRGPGRCTSSWLAPAAGHSRSKRAVCSRASASRSASEGRQAHGQRCQRSAGPLKHRNAGVGGDASALSADPPSPQSASPGRAGGSRADRHTPGPGAPGTLQSRGWGGKGTTRQGAAAGGGRHGRRQAGSSSATPDCRQHAPFVPSTMCLRDRPLAVGASLPAPGSAEMEGRAGSEWADICSGQHARAPTAGRQASQAQQASRAFTAGAASPFAPVPK